MPILIDTSFFKMLKTGTVYSLYLLYGDEHFFVAKAEKMLLDVISPKTKGNAPSFNLVKLEGENLDLSDLEESLNSLPLMFCESADKKVVIVKDLDFENLLKADFEQILSIIENVCDDSILVFYQPNITVNLKKAPKFKKIIDLIAQTGIVCEFPIKDKSTLKRALCERAKKSYLMLTMETADILIDRCSSSYSILDNEMDKLIAFAQGENANEITAQMINACAIENIEGSAFDLAKNILNNRFDNAFNLLDDLFYLRQDPVMIIAALSLAFLDIYRAKIGNSTEQIQVDFAYAKTRLWVVKNAMRDCKNIKLSQIQCCIKALFNADIEIKSSKLDKRLIIEQAFFKMQKGILECPKK